MARRYVAVKAGTAHLRHMSEVMMRVRMSAELHARLREASHDRRTSMNALVLEALNGLLRADAKVVGGKLSWIKKAAAKPATDSPANMELKAELEALKKRVLRLEHGLKK